MAEHSRYQQGIIRRAYEHKDTIALQRLSEIVSDLYVAEGGTGIKKLWDSARIALVKVAPNDPRVAKVLSSRNVSDLAKFVSELSAGVRSPQETEAADDADAPVVGEGALTGGAAQTARPGSIEAQRAAVQARVEDTSPPTADECKLAMKAFRKRLKLKRLDDESKLGRSPLSSGKASRTVAIMAPREYRQTVWDELVRQGKLKKSGSFYELVE